MPLLFRRLSLCVAMALTLILGTSVGAEAQRLHLEWNVRATRGFYEATRQVVFGPTPQIELQLTIGHDEDATDFVMLEPGLLHALTIQLLDLETGGQIATVTHWQDDANCLINVFGPCSLELRISLPPGGWLQATAVLAPSTRPEIPEGQYLIDLDFTKTRPFLRGVNNEQWQGRLQERGTVPLMVRRASTRDDRRHHYRIEGGAAMLEGDYSRALHFYERWMIEFPDEPQGYAGVGIVLVELVRFQEAIPLLERALAVSRRGPGRVPLPLATAYLGIGQDDRAMDMLQRYLAAEAIPRRWTRRSAKWPA